MGKNCSHLWLVKHRLREVRSLTLEGRADQLQTWDLIFFQYQTLTSKLILCLLETRVL